MLPLRFQCITRFSSISKSRLTLLIHGRKNSNFLQHYTQGTWDFAYSYSIHFITTTIKNLFFLENFKGLILKSISLLANTQIVSSAILD